MANKKNNRRRHANAVGYYTACNPYGRGYEGLPDYVSERRPEYLKLAKKLRAGANLPRCRYGEPMFGCQLPY